MSTENPLKSDYNPIIWNNANGVDGNIRIIDPNPLGEIVPHEDLFMYVSLKANQRSKSLLTKKDSSDTDFEIKNFMKNTIDLTVPQQKVELVDGSKLFSNVANLSTEWTEIGGTFNESDLGKDFEGFGITNIDIEVKSQTNPKVVIDFVDVRGATLMEQGSCSPYALFYNLPYPLFTLTLKGYYGRPVKYYLNLVKFTCKFNSDTGNMECRGEFLGWSFAFLADVLVSYASASQYLDNSSYAPNEKLSRKYSETWDYYKDSGLIDQNTPNPFCNIATSEGGTRCKTIKDLLTDIYVLQNQTLPDVKSSFEFDELQNILGLRNAYQTYVENFDKLKDELGKLITNPTPSKASDSSNLRFGLTSEVVSQGTLDKVKVITSQYFKKESGILPILIKNIKTYGIKDGVQGFEFLTEKKATLLTEESGKNLTSDDNSGTKNIYNLLNEKDWQLNLVDGYNSSKTKDDKYPTYWIDLGFIQQSINEDVELLNSEIDKRRTTVIDEMNSKIETVVGFKPTIRNIFTVLLCNSDVFMEILKEVSEKAETHHLGENLKTYTNVGNSPSRILSSGDKVFAWPTYFERNFTPKKLGKSQGTKEVYPGTVNNFTNWPEVRFVEDFIRAFTEFQKDIELLNDEKAGKPGFDNYAPINPLETPLNSDSYFLPYKEIQSSGNVASGEGFWKLIGERLFVSLDHTYNQPYRFDENSKNIPDFSLTSFPQEKKVTPLSRTNDKRKDFIQKLGSIDAWNLVNTIESPIAALTVTNTSQTDEEFIKNIIDILNKNGTITTVKASDLVNNGVTAINPNEEYYVFKPSDSKGIKLNGEGVLGGDPIYIKPNPHEMEVSNLFKIIDGNGLNPRAIEITNDTFKSKLSSYAEILEENIDSVIPTTNWEFKGITNLNSSKLDDKQQTLLFDSGIMFTTLEPLGEESGFFENGPNASSWFAQNNTSLMDPGSLGWFSIYDINSDVDDTLETHLSSGDLPSNIRDAVSSQFLGSLISEDEIKTLLVTTDTISFTKYAASPFVMSPLWLDNVNKFRISANKQSLGTFSSLSFKQYTTEDIQYRNLGYLFLQTLKTTPLVIRETDDDLDMRGENGYVNTFSLKAFSSGAGIVKTPKSWVLSLGSILWRWKCFVGVNNGVWNNPLKGQIPTGFDPLAQPSFGNTTDRNDSIVRNNIDDYLTHIYGTNNWLSRVQKSAFSDKGWDKRVAYATNIGDIEKGIRFAFNYFDVYQTDTTLKSPRVKSTNDGLNIVPTTSVAWTDNYGWPQLWIAPHHIPYTQPVSICKNDGNDTDETDASYLTILSNTSWSSIDYQTMMSQRLNGGNIGLDFELQNYGRDNRKDGGLGFILMNLPDSVKDEFVRIFEEWASNEWKEDIKIVDPANFAGDNIYMSDYYDVRKDKDGKPIRSTTTSTLEFELKNNSNSSVDSLKQKLMVDNYVIINSTPKIWMGVEKENFKNDGFFVSREDFETYLKAFKSEFNEAIPKKVEEVNKKQSKEEEILSGTIIDDDDIKLSLYRTFKSMSDKWISVDKDGKMFFNITESDDGYCNNPGGKEMVGKSGKSTLATHFQYVNRTMVDIGNEAVIDITKLNELKDNLKISLYQYLSDLLTENDYLFFPLPSYINFGANGMKTEDLLDMFRPTMSLKKVSCGPLFLSMYVGGNSRSLKLQNLGQKVNCPIDVDALSDDGFDLSGDSEKPEDFKSPKATDPGITAFRVVYGTENQNHFKNIQLDQSEFSETAESLLVIDKLAQQGGTDQSSKGQNLHNVYLTRSYTCQVESFGNMMIQPMTYFDLFGVPMFNGAYLITEVRHNFKPNHATTTFKGVRQPIATVPIITDAATAMNLSLKNVEASKNKKSLSQAGTGRSSGVTGGIPGNPVLGTNCGEFTIDIQGSVSNSDKFIKTKPIRDFVASVESGTCDKGYNSYNYYNSDGGLVSIVACRKEGSYKPVTMTIGDIKKAHADRTIFAVGKYQLIPDTFIAMTKELKFNDTDIFNEDRQEQSGEWLIMKKRPNLAKYFASDSLGLESDLQKAITDLAQEFASFPAYHTPIQVNGKFGGRVDYNLPIGYNSKSAVYGGNGGNPSASKYCTQDVAKYLIQTWRNLYPNKQPQFTYDGVLAAVAKPAINNDSMVNKCTNDQQKINFNQNSKKIIMGSSSVGTLNKVLGKVINVPTNSVDISYNCVGQNVKYLTESMKNDTNIYKNVDTIYLAGIGTNDGYKDLGIDEFDKEIMKKFPNVKKKVILPGTIGWGSVKDKTKSDQDKYYNIYVSKGWIYDYPTNVTGSFADQGEAHNPKAQWFISLTDTMKKYNV